MLSGHNYIKYINNYILINVYIKKRDISKEIKKIDILKTSKKKVKKLNNEICKN